MILYMCVLQAVIDLWFFLFQQVFIPKRTGKPLPEEEKKEILKNFDDVLTEFAAYFLKDSPYIAGEEVSIADIFAVSEVS